MGPLPVGGQSEESPFDEGNTVFGFHGVAPSRPTQDAGREGISTAEQAIRRQLNANTELDFLEAPLAEVVEYLENLHDINIRLDGTGLATAGGDSSSPVSFTVRGISLSNALSLILDSLQLDYMVKNDVLFITSKERVAATAVTEVYSTKGIAMTPTAIGAVLRKTLRPANLDRRDKGNR